MIGFVFDTVWFLKQQQQQQQQQQYHHQQQRLLGKYNLIQSPKDMCVFESNHANQTPCYFRLLSLKARVKHVLQIVQKTDRTSLNHH